ncbi:MAG: response regulator [Deltaproteobacteria bacterium]|nr:response regulator [Deltaproteobacteria bacterium]
MKSSTHIMVVDDEETICEALMAWFVKDGYKVAIAFSGEEALEYIQGNNIDIFLADVKMPGMDGIELLSRIKEKQPEAAVVMMTAHGSIQTAVEAMKLGASDYLCKPFDPDELSLLMERVMMQKTLQRENIALKERLLEQQEDAADGCWKGYRCQGHPFKESTVLRTLCGGELRRIIRVSPRKRAVRS